MIPSAFGGRGTADGSSFLCPSLVVVLCAALGAFGVPVCAQNLTFKIPPQKIPLKLELDADLSELQQDMTDLLSSQLDKEDACGERIAIQQAQLVPVPPASLATVQLHYERWACAKILGKDKSKRLVGGNALIEIKLTPAIEKDNTELRLVPEVGKIEADGSLGELLRSGTLGDMLRDKIRSSILSALEKGTNLSATLPPAIQGHATIQNAEFKDAGGGKLLVVLNGEGRISQQEIQALSKQIKERVAAK
jgi:hypothetical protein